MHDYMTWGTSIDLAERREDMSSLFNLFTVPTLGSSEDALVTTSILFKHGAG